MSDRPLIRGMQEFQEISGATREKSSKLLEERPIKPPDPYLPLQPKRPNRWGVFSIYDKVVLSSHFCQVLMILSQAELEVSLGRRKPGYATLDF